MENDIELSTLTETCRLCLTTGEPRFEIFMKEVSSDCLKLLPSDIRSILQLEVGRNLYILG